LLQLQSVDARNDLEYISIISSFINSYGISSADLAAGDTIDFSADYPSGRPIDGIVLIVVFSRCLAALANFRSYREN
jgi:hypothetical protein